MFKDSFYRACSITCSDGRKAFKEKVSGYTRVFDDVILHCYLHGSQKCVIEDRTGMCIGYYSSSYRDAFDEAYKALVSVSEHNNVTIPVFIRSFTSLEDIKLTNFDVFVEVNND